MDFLEDEVLGSRRAVSAPQLGLAQSLAPADAEALLAAFWAKHRDRLDLAYQITTVEHRRRTVRVVDHRDVPAGSTARAYIVSNATAAAPLVRAECGVRRVDAQIGASVGALQAAGMATNPLLDGEFVVATQAAFGPLLGELARDPKAKNAKPAVRPIPPKPEPKPEPRVEPRVEPKVEPAKASSAAEPESKRAKLEPKKAVKPKGQAALAFRKADKADALRAAFKAKPLATPVAEKVVMAEDAAEDAEDADAERPERRADRASEMKNLAAIFDAPAQAAAPAEAADEAAAERWFEASDEENEAADVEMAEAEPELVEKAAEEPAEMVETDEAEMEVEHVEPVETVETVESEPVESEREPSKPQMEQVFDEETGFTMFVPKLAKAAPKAAPKAAKAAPKAEPKAEPKAASEAKPADKKRPKQGSLMSFFNIKK